jgi:hypothetical protein
MLDRIPPEFIALGRVMLMAMLLSVVAASLLLALTYRRLKRLRIPPGADFLTTLRHVPLTLVLFLDLLDFGLDFFSAPIAWVILDDRRLVCCTSHRPTDWAGLGELAFLQTGTPKPAAATDLSDSYSHPNLRCNSCRMSFIPNSM